MLLFDLGKLPGQQSMLIFHALARMGVEALVIVSPQSLLVSIGYFTNAQKEVDLSYCAKAGIPVMRRELGGGVTYLDQNQIFYQLIWRKDRRDFPGTIQDIYGQFSEPCLETYMAFGIDTEFQPVNDIVTKDGKKIAGEAGGDVGECMVFVGGILLDFNYETMSRIFRSPDEEFRGKVYAAMEKYLTTMKRELGTIPPRKDVVAVLKQEFEKRTGKLEPVSLTPEILGKMKQLELWMTSEEFLLKKTSRNPTGVKIKEGVEIPY